ncbi:DNA-binding protein [Mesorhizobium sp. LSHC422A00]|nr:DNA-binding protein [Mesorhizobium sp. LSHC422A00]
MTPSQCRMARAALQIGVRQLAHKAGISSMTVTRFENGHSAGAPETVDALRAALESAGVEFIPENGGGAGVRLRKVGGIDSGG